MGNEDKNGPPGYDPGVPSGPNLGRASVTHYRPIPLPPEAMTGAGLGRPPPRRPLRRRLASALFACTWVIFGMCVSGYAGLLVFGIYSRIEVDSAIVAGAVEPMKAPASGTLVLASLDAGQTFDSGSMLFRVQNAELDQAIGLQRIAVDRVRAELAQAEATLAAERGRRDDYVLNQRGEIDKNLALVAELGSQVELLTDRCAELTQLYGQGLTQTQRLYEAQDKLSAARQALAQARVEGRTLRKRLELALSGQGADGVEVISRLSEATAAVTRTKAESSLANETLNVMLTRRNQATVAAAAPGRVLRSLRQPGAHVQAGDTVAVIERVGARFIYAYLTQSEVGRVGIGDVAEVFLPAVRLRTRARVIGIERAGGYLDDVETRYDWRIDRDNPQRLTDRDRTARVTLSFGADEADTIEQSFEVGTPLVVSLPKHWGHLVPRLQELASNVWNLLS